MKTFCLSFENKNPHHTHTHTWIQTPLQRDLLTVCSLWNVNAHSHRQSSKFEISHSSNKYLNSFRRVISLSHFLSFQLRVFGLLILCSICFAEAFCIMCRTFNKVYFFRGCLLTMPILWIFTWLSYQLFNIQSENNKAIYTRISRYFIWNLMNKNP